MSAWKLPFDVISNIMTFSSPTDIASLMETCHVLHGEGPKYLLRDGVTLRTPRDVTSFVTFMLAEGNVRFLHLRKLDLAVGNLERRPFDDDGRGAAADCLGDFLQRPALSLHTLRLQKAEALLSSSPLIRAAFRTLTTIQHLIVCHVGPATVATFRKMPSKLVSATIDHLGNLDPTLYLTPCDQALSMLEASSDTLEDLSLVLDRDPYVPERPTSICFPRVRSLTILSESCHFLARWLDAFPNVQLLHHNPCGRPQPSMICASAISSFIDGLSVWRQWNTDFSLSMLTECSSDLLSFCTLSSALMGVRKLRVSTQVHDLSSLLLLRMTLTVARLSEMELSVLGVDTLKSVVPLIGTLGLETLRTLRINFSFGEDDYDAYRNKADALERLSGAVDDLPSGLTAFDLVVDPSLPGLCGAEWRLDDGDVRALRDHFAASSSSCLKQVVLRPFREDLPDPPCEEEFDGDSDARSDRSEWGSARYSWEDEESDWGSDDD